MKKDDQTLSKSDEDYVRRHAHLLLKKANAYDRFPTPISDLVAAAKLEIERDIQLDSTFLGRLYKMVREPVRHAELKIKRAIDKVQGLLWRVERRILLDPNLYPSRRTFITLHETGHEFLPAQRSTFALLEDSDSELDPETKDIFERQANVFASDVLFQLDRFEKDAFDCSFGLRTPVDLSKRFGASVYASARRYVQNHPLPCALVVFNPPIADAAGMTMRLRRAFQSSSFTTRFGHRNWPETCAADSFFLRNLPRRSFGRVVTCMLNDLNSIREECIVESFNSTYQVFFFIYPASHKMRVAVA